MNAADDLPEEVLIPPGLEQVFHDICGCGMCETWALVRDVLSAASESGLGAWIGESPEREFIAHYLGSFRVGLLEHGSSVYGSWPAEKGKAALVWLDRHMAALDGRGEVVDFVDSDGVIQA
ncbi:MAG: hypothetical protein GY720_15810 [bacterium]|nr:hypothetical protein [bacterium]